MLVPWAARTGPAQTFHEPADILLAVEVVSAESAERDRRIKPRKYAAAGIRHFWRVEGVDGRPVVYVHEADPATGVYALTGIHHDRLRVPVPVALDIDLSLRRPPQP